MYSSVNYKTKKALKEEIARCDAEEFYVFQPGPFGEGERLIRDGETVTLEGPHYPEPHKWYAQVTNRGGKLTVK